MNRLRSSATVLAGVALTIAVAGCSPLVELEDGRATVVPERTGSAPSASSSAPRTTASPAVHECVGHDAIFTAADTESTVVGDCPNVQVQGSDISVDLTAARVGSLTVSGDGNTVAAGVIATTTIAGQHNGVVLGSGETVVVTGDDNSIDVTGALATVRISGQANTVLARTIDAVHQAGSGNTVRARG